MFKLFIYTIYELNGLSMVNKEIPPLYVKSQKTNFYYGEIINGVQFERNTKWYQLS